MADGMFQSHIHQKRKPRSPLSDRIAKNNTRRSKIRAHVEHVFAGQKQRMGLVVRTIGITRATIKTGMANLVYNFQPLVWLKERIAPAWCEIRLPAALAVWKPPENTGQHRAKHGPVYRTFIIIPKSSASSRCPGAGKAGYQGVHWRITTRDLSPFSDDR